MSVANEVDLIVELEGWGAELDDVLEYLDRLRESGRTNMFGAAPYVRRVFGLPVALASMCTVYWMETFSERAEANGTLY